MYICFHKISYGDILGGGGGGGEYFIRIPVGYMSALWLTLWSIKNILDLTKTEKAMNPLIFY